MCEVILKTTKNNAMKNKILAGLDNSLNRDKSKRCFINKICICYMTINNINNNNINNGY